MDKFQIISDIHIERFYPNVPDWKNIINKEAETLVLAGDIGHLEYFEQYYEFVKSLSENFEKIIIVPGNHEFYSKTISYENLFTRLENLEKLENVIILTNKKLDLNDEWVLYGTILWSYIPEPCRIKELNIFSNENVSSITWHNREHLNCVYELEKFFNENNKNGNKKVIVVSHYPPILYNTIRCNLYTEKLRFYYASNLERLLSPENMKIWIYGHTHKNTSFLKNDVLLLSNQYRGYNSDKSKIVYLE